MVGLMEASILLVQSDNLVHRPESVMAFILNGKWVLIYYIRYISLGYLIVQIISINVIVLY